MPLAKIAALLLLASSPQVPGGFTPIFNGKDLTGWHVSRTDHHGSTPEAEVRDGVLLLKQAPYGQGGVLLTDARYGDFELYLEVKAPPGCNSGIFLRSTEGGSAYQIELDQGRGTGNLLGENLAVGQAAEAAGLKSVWKDGEWNSFLIQMTGAAPHLREWINGKLMWDVQELRNDKVAGETDGMIGLQTHWASTYEPAEGSFNLPGSWKPGAAFQFRNIGIKILRAAPLETAIPLVRVEPGSMRVAVFQPACPAGGAVLAALHWTAADAALCRQLAKRDASPGFQVTIAKPFYLGKFEITQAQWSRVMGSNPSVFRGADRPVDSVTWDDAQAFVQKLNELEKTHAYRLPTEFEWEYAGRAGGSGQTAWTAIRKQAVAGSQRTTQPVGSKEPNAWGLYDMLGNVWEWVADGYNGKTFPDAAPPADARQHVLKGGGFLSDVKNTIYATHGAGPGDGWDVGFRIAKDVEPLVSGADPYATNCALCHGATARGGAHGGPDLTQSRVLQNDANGEQLGAFLRVGRPAKGMPAFQLKEEEVRAIAAFLHAMRPPARATEVVVGDAAAGERFFNGEGGCAKCHSAAGDLKGIGSKYEPAALQGRMVLPIGNGGYPGYSPVEPSLTQVTVKGPRGETFTGKLIYLSDYAVTWVDAAGERHTMARHGAVPQIELKDPLQAHLDRQLILTDRQMHDLTAFLASLK